MHGQVLLRRHSLNTWDLEWQFLLLSATASLALPFILDIFSARSVLDFWISSDRVDMLTCQRVRSGVDLTSLQVLAPDRRWVQSRNGGRWTYCRLEPVSCRRDLLKHKSPLPSLELHGREIRVGAGGKHVVDGGAVGLRGQEAAFPAVRQRHRNRNLCATCPLYSPLSSCQRVGRRLCERPESAGPRVSNSSMNHRAGFGIMSHPRRAKKAQTATRAETKQQQMKCTKTTP